MADHSVLVQLPEVEIGRADATFKIKKSNKLIGTIKISHGKLEYRPTGWSEKNIIKIDWTKLDELLRDFHNGS